MLNVVVRLINVKSFDMNNTAVLFGGTCTCRCFHTNEVVVFWAVDSIQNVRNNRYYYAHFECTKWLVIVDVSQKGIHPR